MDTIGGLDSCPVHSLSALNEQVTIVELRIESRELTRTTMRATVCHQHGDPDVIQCEEMPDPKPSDQEVLIRAEAIAVNYVDTMPRSGKHPAAPGVPFTPGIEMCGRVEAIGPAVTRRTDVMIRHDLKSVGIPCKTDEGIADFHAAGWHTHTTELLRNGASVAVWGQSLYNPTR